MKKLLSILFLLIGFSLEALDQSLLKSASDEDLTKIVFDYIKNGESYEKALTTDHEDYILLIKCSPCGKYLTSYLANKTIKIWDLQTGQCIKTLTDCSDIVKSITYSPCGKYLALSSSNATIKIWNVQTDQCIKTLTGHLVNVSSVLYSPCGRYLASCSWDKTIKIWNVKTGKCIKTLTGHYDFVELIAYSPCGRYLASCSSDKTIKIWDVKPGKCLKTLQNNSSKIDLISYSPCGKYLASISSFFAEAVDKTIKIWDIKTGKCVKVLTCSSSIVSITYSKCGKYLVLNSSNATIIIMDIQTGKCITTLTCSSIEVLTATYSYCGRYVALKLIDKTTKILDIQRLLNEARFFENLFQFKAQVVRDVQNLILKNIKVAFIKQDILQKFIDAMSSEDRENYNKQITKWSLTFANVIANSTDTKENYLIKIMNEHSFVVKQAQSKKHAILNLSKIKRMRESNVWTFNNKVVQNYQLRMYLQEKAEHFNGNYVFYHGRQWFWNFYSDIWKVLYNITKCADIGDDYQFLRFGTPGPRRIEDQDLLFMNWAMQGNATRSSSSSISYVIRNHDYSANDGRVKFLSIEYIFKEFSMESLYKKYEKELLELQKIHNGLSGYGEMLMICLPSNKLDNVISTESGGVVRPVEIDGRQVSDTKEILDNVHKLDNSDNLEFGLVLGSFKKNASDPSKPIYEPSEYVMDPINGPRIYSFYIAGEKAMEEFRDKRDKLFARIRKDYEQSKKIVSRL